MFTLLLVAMAGLNLYIYEGPDDILNMIAAIICISGAFIKAVDNGY